MTPSDDGARRKLILAAFRMPSVQTMLSRKSSITNAVVNSVIPVLPPSTEEIEQALTILGMDPLDVRCAYCGDKSSEWDHLRPLVWERRPTGFISEIANLVPACGKCNQSKGNKPWRDWMRSKTRHSPAGRQIADLAERIARLEGYERWREPTKIDFASVIGVEAWERYWAICETIIEDMRKCHEVAETIRLRIATDLEAKKPGFSALAVVGPDLSPLPTYLQ